MKRNIKMEEINETKMDGDDTPRVSHIIWTSVSALAVLTICVKGLLFVFYNSRYFNIHRLFIHMYVCRYACMYVYIDRKRQRGRETETEKERLILRNWLTPLRILLSPESAQ